jgi:4-amino-4-deoxy-L-arabinose transferase-like glycosyltransferase
LDPLISPRSRQPADVNRYHSLVNAYWRRAALVLILGYAAFLRLHALTTTPPGLYRDEAMNGNNALETLETHSFAVFYPENNGREGLYINVAVAFVGWFGNQAWTLRLPAAIFGVLTVAGLYLLGAECFGAWTGLAAAFFLATSFWHVNFSRMALRAITAPCFLVWSVYLLLSGMRRAKWWLLAAAGVIYGLGFYTYIAYRATPLLLAFLLRRATARVRRLFSLTAAAVAAPLALYFARHPRAFWERSGGISVLHNPHPAAELLLNTWRTARMFFRRGDLNWRHNIAYRAELYWPVAALFALGVLLAAVRVYRSRGHKGAAPYSLPLAWLAMAALPVVLSDEMLPHALRSLLMTPAVFLLAAVGAHQAYAWLAARFGPRAAGAAVAVILIWLAWEPWHSYFDVWARNPNVPPAFDAATVDLAERIRRTPGDKIVVVPLEDDMAAAPLMFLTRTYTANEQRARHIRYLPAAVCPPGAAFCLAAGAARYDK